VLALIKVGTGGLYDAFHPLRQASNNLIPIFADIYSKTYNISPTEIEKKITPKTKVLIPVDFAGQAVVVSCGLGSEEEIGEAVDAIIGEGLSKDQIILLKCTSEYPANFEDMNFMN